MKHERISRYQNYIFVAGGISAMIGLGAKSVLTSDKSISMFISQEYFIDNIDKANFVVYIYWISIFLFMMSIVILAILQYKKVD